MRASMAVLQWSVPVVALLLAAGSALAAEEKAKRNWWEPPEEAVAEVKSVTGQVSLIRPNSLSVVYAKDEKKGMDYEMVLPLSEKVRYVRAKGPEGLSLGDTVRVTYEELKWVNADDEEGLERRAVRAKEIEFVRPAITGLRSE